MISMTLVVSIGVILLGLFCAVFPERAAHMWSAQLLAKIPLESRSAFLSCYRVFGMVFAAAGIYFMLIIIKR
jgi:hypothetical protein